jgi:hypothetical protein
MGSMPIRPFVHPALIAMGIHVARVRLRRALLGHKRYPGTAEDILRGGLEDCWTGQILTASPGTYRQFWTRDTAFAAPSLMRLGDPWPERLLSTLEWAMGTWSARAGHVTTTINPLLRWPVDVFDYGVDSLPLLLRTLQVLAESGGPAADMPAKAAQRVADGALALAHEHRDWIAAEVEHFVQTVVDPATGLVRSDRHFSAHRDTFKNGSTTYANTMVALLARTVAQTGWGPDLMSQHFLEDGAVRTPPGNPPAAPITSAPLAMRVAGIQSHGTDSSSLRIPRTRIGRDGGNRRIGAQAREREATGTSLNQACPGTRIPPTRIGQEREATGTSLNQTYRGTRIPPTRIGEGTETRASGPPGVDDVPDWGVLLRRHFWTGDRFRDRLGSDETSGEANVWPFHAGLIDDRGMLVAALATLDREGYTTPYPLRFDVAHSSERIMLAYRLWSADYQTTTSWTSLGSIYLALLGHVDAAAAAAGLNAMRRLIERDRIFWEVLDGAGRPWRSGSRLSTSDVSMLWGAILLEELLRQRGGQDRHAASS